MWSHFKRLIYLDDTRKREFYTKMCRLERWSTRFQETEVNSCQKNSQVPPVVRRPLSHLFNLPLLNNQFSSDRPFFLPMPLPNMPLP